MPGAEKRFTWRKKKKHAGISVHCVLLEGTPKRKFFKKANQFGSY